MSFVGTLAAIWQRSSFLAGCVLILSSLLVAGCETTFEQPHSIVLRKMKTERALVFFGFRHNEMGEPFDLRLGRTPERSDILHFTLYNLETGKEITNADSTYTSFDGPDGAQWAGYTLPPGRYFLKVIPPIGRQYLNRWDWRQNRYIINIKESGAVYYGGTFSVTCIAREAFLLGRYIKHCEPLVKLEDDYTRAEAAVQNWDYPEGMAAGPFEPLPLIDLAAEPAGNAMDLEALTSSFEAPEGLSISSEWSQFDNRTKPQPGLYMGSRLSPGSSGGAGGLSGCYGPGCAGLLVIALAVAGVVVAADAAEASTEKSEWATCLKDSAAHLEALAPETVLERQWRSLVRSVAQESVQIVNETSSPSPGTLKLDLYRAMLRKCPEPEEVCLELALRATLETRAGSRTLERMYIYTGKPFSAQPHPNHIHFTEVPSHPWWEEPAGAVSKPRRFSEFCGEAGGALWRDEFSKGAEALLDAVARDLRRSPQERN